MSCTFKGNHKSFYLFNCEKCKNMGCPLCMAKGLMAAGTGAMTVENEGNYNNGGRRWLRWICLHCGHRNHQWDRE